LRIMSMLVPASEKNKARHREGAELHRVVTNYVAARLS